MKILIAEDEPTSRMVLKAHLRQWDHEVVECTDGATALEILQGPEAPPLVILDWQMPGIDGLEVCRRMRQDAHSMLPYIIFVTARDHADDILAGLRAGADDYITKPLRENELYARLQVGRRVVNLWSRLLEAERNRVLMQTAGAAAHEINNPLTILMGKVQLLQMQATDESFKRHLEQIHDNAQRIGRIVSNMETARQYATKPYIKGTDIVDFDQSKNAPNPDQDR